MNADIKLWALRGAVERAGRGPGKYSDDPSRQSAYDAGWWEELAGELVREFAALNSHLSSGGRPPEAWAEGPDEPSMDEPRVPGVYLGPRR